MCDALARMLPFEGARACEHVKALEDQLICPSAIIQATIERYHWVFEPVAM